MRNPRRQGLWRWAVAVLAALTLGTAVVLGIRAHWDAQVPQDQADDGVGADEAEEGDNSFDADPTEDQDPVEDDDISEGGYVPMSLLARRVDDYLRQNVPDTSEPGVAVALVDASGPGYLGTFGDVTSVHDRFVIGSLSKSFTAVCVMQLVEQGRVDLAAPVATYVPDYGTPQDVTVLDLLNQTSGFGYYDSLSEATPGPTQGHFSYANANYDLLGRIVERVSGESYADYLAEHVLGPLGMEDSSASVDARSQALGHRNYLGFNVTDGFVHQDGDEAWGTGASGYVTASVEDMGRYLSMYLAGGEGDGMRVLEPQSIEQMVYDRVPDPDGDTFYGMGWTSYYLDDGELVLSHDAQVENGIARMCLLPQRGVGVVMMADASDYFGGNDEFWQLADGVVSLALGGHAQPVDGSVHVWQHVGEDAYLLVVALICLMPLLGLRAWRRDLGRVSLGPAAFQFVLVHVVAPAILLLMPGWADIRWRDLATFVPDVALVVGAGAAVLVATGVAKLVLWLRWRRAARAQVTGPRA